MTSSTLGIHQRSSSQIVPMPSEQSKAPASFVNKPARGWLHPDNLIAKVMI